MIGLPVFVFGTLLDADVRRLVIGRDLGADQLSAAVVRGYRRVQVAARVYPMLLAHNAGQVHGLLLHQLDPEALRRLIIYEGEDYRLAAVAATDERGRCWNAQAFLSEPWVRPSRRNWHLNRWQRQSKGPFLRHVANLMAGYDARATAAFRPGGGHAWRGITGRPG